MSTGFSVKISGLREYAAASKKDFQQIVNDKALDWAFKAQQQTERADAAQIATELGQESTKISLSKSGQFKARKRIFKDNSFAARIINARRKRSGEALLFGKAMETAVRKLVNARIKARAFIASGFRASIQTLKRFSSDPRIRTQASDSSVKQRGQPKGYAIHATQVLAPVATIVNTANKGEPRAAAVAEEGLRRGAAIVEADMAQYTERKMQETANKHSAK